MRSSGVLLHITSLPSPYGIGTLGRAAYDFADFLRAAGQRYWQILPLGPSACANSPYQTYSSFAGNPYLIDLDFLIKDGLLTQAEVNESCCGAASDRTDYDYLYRTRLPLLHQAFLRGRDRFEREIESFRRENPWVEDYALYMAIKRSRGMCAWNEWPEEIRLRHPGARETYAIVLAEDTNFFVFMQFLFFRQWDALLSYVHAQGIEIIGDLPIYVPYDSCDVWTQPEMFQLDAEGTPTAVAGCPPDCFSEDGQLWGNPLYDWERMREDGYHWWKKRIAAAARLFDVVRIDHFRGLESYWSVPYGAPTARNGKWVPGPAEDFIRMLHQSFPELRLIAEDLGLLTPEVVKLQKDSGFPGMKVLEFAFDPDTPSAYLPHRYERNCICYTGTHDNETLAQWLQGLDARTLSYVRDYLGVQTDKECHWGLLRAGASSVADTFIAQLQDYLELCGEARMNTPGTVGKQNWSWRMDSRTLTSELASRMRKMVALYERG